MRSDVIELVQSASALVGVRAWHNRTSEPYGGASAHPTIEIAWTETVDPIAYAIGSQQLVLAPGAPIVVPGGIEHTTRIAPGARGRVIALEPSVIEEMADAMSLRLSRAVAPVTLRPRLVALCGLVFAEAVERAEGHDLAIDALMEALAVEVLRHPSSHAGAADGTGPLDPRIRRAVDFIDASYAKPLTLDAIARVAGMSRFYFGRVFEAQVGRSPHRYLVDVRIARAKTLLQTGRVAVTQAALSVGYNDLGRFGRAFRARVGVAPSQVAAACRARATVLST